MSTETANLPHNRLSAARAILYGTLVVGLLDLTEAIVFYGMRGVKPIRIPQSIAGGLLGRATFNGGAYTALLGVGLHFFISFAIVATYYLASKRLSILTRRPLLCGLVYGVLVYIFMNAVVLPLSAAPSGWPPLPVLLNGIIGHALLVGLPSAFFVTLARRGR
jgi:uncharacterized membrane protein YagU involved in acid resistance